MRTTQTEFAEERTSGYRETRLTAPDTSAVLCEWSGVEAGAPHEGEDSKDTVGVATPT